MHKLSKTKIKNRASKKTNPDTVETLQLALKNKAWHDVAKIISGPTRNYSSKNLFEIDKEAKANDIIVIPGKVLSKGELTKKVKIAALSFSEKAQEKAKQSKSELVTILEEIKKNPKGEKIKILR